MSPETAQTAAALLFGIQTAQTAIAALQNAVVSGWSLKGPISLVDPAGNPQYIVSAVDPTSTAILLNAAISLFQGQLSALQADLASLS